MPTGLETAFGEITLVLFTTLAPGGALAVMVLAVYMIAFPLELEERRRLNQFLAIPLVVSMIGLIASATHLGNPANALYVFLGVGRSPLSTEVFSAVIFLLFTGVYWLSSFSTRIFIRLQKVWLAVIFFAGAAFIASMAFAYDAETIISWNTVYVPVNLCLNAFVGGPLLALITLQVAGVSHLEQGRRGKVLCAISAVALVANTASLCFQGATLPSIENSFATVSDLVPFYGACIAGFFLLAGSGIALYALPLMRGRLPKLSQAIIACLLTFTGIFVTRFTFYMMHMTIGLGM